MKKYIAVYIFRKYPAMYLARSEQKHTTWSNVVSIKIYVMNAAALRKKYRNISTMLVRSIYKLMFLQMWSKRIGIQNLSHGIFGEFGYAINREIFHDTR